MARKVDVALLGQLNAGAEKQEVKKGGFSKTSDPNFPVFGTPVNKDILVYIPLTNSVSTENGVEMRMLNVHTHTYKEGNYMGMMRCISGLEGSVYSEVLGYDGTCPACDAVKDCWALYNRKLDAEARKLGIDPQNDTADVLKGARQRILSEMDIKGSEEYVTFPIVIIPTQEGTVKPTADALKNLIVQYVVWTKKRYEKNILGALDSMLNNPGHPGGMFWVWKFSYDTGGKQANARDSAKNAKYMPIQDNAFLEMLNKAKPALEAVAKDFTNEKASEVVISNQFMYKEDLAEKVNKIMAKTRQLLEISEAESLGAPTGVGNQLASFGGALPTSMGVETDVKFGE